MKLPKYETFSIIGIINVLIGAYVYKMLTSMGFNTFYSIIGLLIYYIIIIVLYENLKIELELNIKKKNKEDN